MNDRPYLYDGPSCCGWHWVSSVLHEWEELVLVSKQTLSCVLLKITDSSSFSSTSKTTVVQMFERRTRHEHTMSLFVEDEWGFGSRAVCVGRPRDRVAPAVLYPRRSAARLNAVWLSRCRQTNGHTTMRWSANVGTTSKTAFTAYGTRCLPCREKRLVKFSLRVLQAQHMMLKAVM